MKAGLCTLCYIEQGDQYLMLHRIRKKKDVNKDKWIGVGGHFEHGESPEDCLLREVKEETGLTLTSYRFRGLVTFCCDDWDIEYMCLYTADGFEGELTDCDEGNLEWVEKSKIPQLNLWEGDRIFFQLLEDQVPFFSLKLDYRGDRLIEAVLNGEPLELLDILGDNGLPSGHAGARIVLHRDGRPHATAHVWIVRYAKTPYGLGQWEILLQKRSQGKDAFPGCYDISSAGHIVAGADYLESALREMKEELGIQAASEDLIWIGDHDGYDEAVFYGKPFRNHEISKVYVYQKEIDINQLTLQPEEVESVCWMKFEDVISGMQGGSLDHCISQDEFIMLGEWLGKENE